MKYKDNVIDRLGEIAKGLRSEGQAIKKSDFAFAISTLRAIVMELAEKEDADNS